MRLSQIDTFLTAIRPIICESSVNCPRNAQRRASEGRSHRLHFLLARKDELLRCDAIRMEQLIERTQVPGGNSVVATGTPQPIAIRAKTQVLTG